MCSTQLGRLIVVLPCQIHTSITSTIKERQYWLNKLPHTHSNSLQTIMPISDSHKFNSQGIKIYMNSSYYEEWSWREGERKAVLTAISP
jgi:hypothetical protein